MISSATYLGEITGRLRHRCCGLSKVRRKPRYQVTPAARYVAKRHGRVARMLRELFLEWRRSFVRQIRDAAERAGLGKALSPADQIMKDVIDALDIEGMSKDIAEELKTEMAKSFKKAGVESTKQILGSTPKQLVQQLDVKAREYARKRAAEMVGASGGEWSISGAMRAGLKKIVTRAVEEGWSVDKLTTEIEDSYPFSEGRAQTIARTELAMSHVEGNVQGWRETGLVDRKKSILGDLHDITDECDENAEAGAVEVDEQFPSGDMFPPYHPNCVCDVLPVMKEEE